MAAETQELIEKMFYSSDNKKAHFLPAYMPIVSRNEVTLNSKLKQVKAGDPSIAKCEAKMKDLKNGNSVNIPYQQHMLEQKDTMARIF